jgi:6-phosphogluconolactonase
MKTMAWIGSYTDERLAGIHVLDVDSATGELRPLHVPRGIENPTYLALNRARTRLFTVCGRKPGDQKETAGAVAAYAVEGSNLTLLNVCPTPGTVPCHLSLSPDERALVFAEYAQAHAGLVALDANGALMPDSLVTVQHEGRGPDPVRQERAHAHFAAVTPDDRWLYVCDLGLDQVILYDFANARRGLRADPARTFHAAPGAGPRHLRFHPNGRLAFLLNELDSTVVSLRYTGESFTALHTFRTLPDGFAGESKAAAVKISEDGRFLFTSNRGYDSIATFAIDAESGRLARLTVSPLTGSFPRDFAFIPGSNLLLVGHKRSDEVAVYAFDPATGAITRRDGTYAVHRPTCILFA